MGKGFELVKVITNAVLAAGGQEEHVLAILSDSKMVTDIVRIILGTGQVVMLHPKQQLISAKPHSIRLRILEYLETSALTDEEWVEVAASDPLPDIREKAVQNVTSQSKLFRLAGNSTNNDNMRHAAVLATHRLLDTRNIKIIVLDSPHIAARLTAAHRLVTGYRLTYTYEEVLNTIHFADRPLSERRYHEALIYRLMIHLLESIARDSIGDEAWMKNQQAQEVIEHGKTRFPLTNELEFCSYELRELVNRLLD